MTLLRAGQPALTKVTCDTQLRLRNEVEGGPADPKEWTLGATGPTGSAAFTSGPSGVTGRISATVPYVLTTAGGNPVYQQRVDPAATLDRLMATMVRPPQKR